jgi:hypothetical protein
MMSGDNIQQFYRIYSGSDGLEVSSPQGKVFVKVPQPSQEDRATVNALIELGARIQMARLRRARKEVKDIINEK